MWLQERPALYLQNRRPIVSVARAHWDLHEVDVSCRRQAMLHGGSVDSTFFVSPWIGREPKSHREKFQMFGRGLEIISSAD